SSGATAVCDAPANRLIVYGGCYANCSPALLDVFVLSNANGIGGAAVWTQSPVTNPQARDYHTSAFSPATNRMVTFGGGLAFFGTDQNDTRVLSNANGAPSTWSTLPVVGALPGKREGHSSIYDASNDRLTVFAGT